MKLIKKENIKNALFTNNDYYLSDNNINNEFILKYYKKYNLLNTPEDNVYNRLKWLLGQIDIKLYISFITKIYSKIDKTKIYNKLVKWKWKRYFRK